MSSKKNRSMPKPAGKPLPGGGGRVNDGENQPGQAASSTQQSQFSPQLGDAERWAAIARAFDDHGDGKFFSRMTDIITARAGSLLQFISIMTAVVCWLAGAEVFVKVKLVLYVLMGCYLALALFALGTIEITGPNTFSELDKPGSVPSSEWLKSNNMKFGKIAMRRVQEYKYVLWATQAVTATFLLALCGLLISGTI